MKSGNVLLDSPPSSSFANKSSSKNNHRCRAMLCDFGLSRRLSHRDAAVSLSERVVGTPAWMSPEVISRQDRVGLPADVYGAAMVTWEMTSGRKPYEGLDFKEMCDSILLGCLPPVDLSAETEMPGLSRLLQSCWHEEPNNRPTAEAMLTTISRLIRQMECGRATTTTDTKVTPRSRSPPRMRRSVSVSSYMVTSPTVGRATPPIMHEKPLSPSKLLEKSLEVYHLILLYNNRMRPIIMVLFMNL